MSDKPIYVSREVYDNLLEFCDKTYGKEDNPMRKTLKPAYGNWEIPLKRPQRPLHEINKDYYELIAGGLFLRQYLREYKIRCWKRYVTVMTGIITVNGIRIHRLPAFSGIPADKAFWLARD